MLVGWRDNTQFKRYPPPSHLVALPLHEQNNVDIVAQSENIIAIITTRGSASQISANHYPTTSHCQKNN
jgi:hypothetical protein